MSISCIEDIRKDVFIWFIFTFILYFFAFVFLNGYFCKMKWLVWFIFFLLFVQGLTCAQETVIHGTVLNCKTKEPIHLAEVVVWPANKGTVTDVRGDFSLKVFLNKTDSVFFQYMGFKQKKIAVKRFKHPFVICLSPERKMLNEVEINEKNIRESELYTEVLSAKALDKVSVTDLGAALREVANVSAIKKGASGVDPVVRGFKFDQLNILINGAAIEGGCPNRMDPPTSHFDVQDVVDIKVFKGPFALQYGTNFGGVILINTVSPVFYPKFETHFNFTAATQTNHLGNDFSAHVFGGNKWFYYKAGYTQSDFGDYKTGADKIVPGNIHRKGTSFALAFRPGKNQLLTLNGNLSQGKNIDFPTLSMDERQDDTRLYNISYKVVRRNKTLHTFYVNFYSAAVNHLMDNKNRPFSDTVTAVSAIKALTRGVNMKTGFKLLGGTLGMGVNYRNVFKNGTRDKYLLLQPGLPVKSEKLWNNASTDNVGFFATFEKSVCAVKWTVAGRIDYNMAASGALQREVGGGGSDTKSHFLNFSFSASVSKEISRRSTLSLSLGSGTRSPNLTERYIILLPVGSDPYDYLGNPYLKPETNYEIDAGYLFHSEKTGDVLAKLFFSYVTHFIGAEFVPAAEMKPATRGVLGVKRFANIPQVYLAGFEISWHTPEKTRWHAGVSVNYTAGINPDADVPVFSYGKIIGTEEIGKDPLPEMPPAECNVFVRYDLFRGRLVPDASLRLVAAQTRISKAYMESGSPGFVLMGLGLRYELRKFISFYGGIKNLFNTNYYEHLNRILVSSGAPLYEPGRIFFIKMKVDL